MATIKEGKKSGATKRVLKEDTLDSKVKRVLEPIKKALEHCNEVKKLKQDWLLKLDELYDDPDLVMDTIDSLLSDVGVDALGDEALAMEIAKYVDPNQVLFWHKEWVQMIAVGT